MPCLPIEIDRPATYVAISTAIASSFGFNRFVAVKIFQFVATSSAFSLRSTAGQFYTPLRPKPMLLNPRARFASLDIQAITSCQTANVFDLVARGAKWKNSPVDFQHFAARWFHGNFFCGWHERRIYRWDSAKRRLSTNDVSFEPVNAVWIRQAI